jgi:dynein heavy chain
MDPTQLFSKTDPGTGFGKNTNGSKNAKDKSKKPTTSTIHMLDHNNMLRTGAPKKTFVTRVQKSTKIPPVRQFPGGVNSNKKAIDENLAQEILDAEENSSSKKLVLSPEELMRDPEYLKIDQSKLPMEMFDNIELAMLDKTPEAWLTSCTRGLSPFFHSGSWVWRPVAVKGYDPVTQEYLIQFLPNGITKGVKRLNLQFEKDDIAKFKDRRQLAEDGRKEAKQIMRLDFFISQQCVDNIRPIRKENIRTIHEKVVDGLPANVPFPEPDTRLGRLLRSLTADIIHFYARNMKKAVLLAQLGGVYANADTIIRYQQLRLPPVPPKPPVPQCGKVGIPDYPFEERISKIENLHYSSNREVLSVYRWLHNKWTQVFQHYNFFDAKLKDYALPCVLKTFKDYQTDKTENMLKLLQKDFRRAFMDQFTDCVQDLFDFFQSNLLVYQHGALSRLFRVLDLRLSTFLRDILLTSLHAWHDMVDAYTKVPEPLEDKSTEVAAEAVQDSSDGEPTEPVEEEVPDASNAWKRRLRMRLSEISFPLDCRTPLFQVQLVYNNGKISLEPSQEDIQVCFIQLIDKMVSSLRTITSIDKDTMSLLVLEQRTLLNIGVGDPLYSDVDGAIRKIKANIMEKITKSMAAPLQLCKMYNDYSWLVQEDVSDYLENFVSGEVSPTAADYQKELEKINTAMVQISELSFHKESFNLVQVTTKNVSDMLYKRASELKEGISNLIITEARQTNVAIIEQYNAILERIAEKPANEKQLAVLRDFIEASKATVQELKNSVNETRKTLKMLETYNIPLSVDDMSLSWSTLEYPSKVEYSGKEVEIALKADKIRMMDKLAAQKEAFEKVVENLGREVKAGLLLDNYDEKEKVVEKMNALMDNIMDAKNKGDDFNMREKVFDFAPTDYGLLDKYVEELGPVYRLWNMVSDFHNSKNDWLNGDFKELEGNKIEEAVSEWWKTSYKLSKSLEEELPGAASCAAKLREETTEFRKNMPVIQSLASKALKRRHWDSLSELLGKNIDPDEDLTLQQLLDLDAAGHIESIQEVTIAAEKEYNLERNMNTMMKEWGSIEFEVKAYKESGTYIVGGIDEIIALLDDHIVKTQTMRGSPYIKPIEKECKEWEYRLKYAQGMLDALINCQRTWMYLEPIFGSEDIIRQLPTEARRFQGVDTLWRKTLAETNNDPNFMTQADPEKRLEEKFKKANEKLDEITKGLNDYLEMKRLYFPRFFFLSNDELLEILSQTKEPRAVQPHLGKCFEGINKVRFENDLKISKIISAEGEEVVMDKMVDPESNANKGNVEKWLLEIESIQWESIRTLTVASLEEYPKISRKKWILNWPAQVILGISSVYWTAEVTQALQAGGGRSLFDCNSKLDGQLRDMVELVRGKLSKLQRKTLGALTTIDVHNRDVVAKMVDLGTKEVADFEWMSQLRYYWEDAWKDGQAVKKGMKTLVARIVNARCLYGYEYLGNTMRLVITALTDRCYRTMIGALDLLYGGAPEGPAGTGKTETVKGRKFCSF